MMKLIAVKHRNNHLTAGGHRGCGRRENPNLDFISTIFHISTKNPNSDFISTIFHIFGSPQNHLSAVLPSGLIQNVRGLDSTPKI